MSQQFSTKVLVSFYVAATPSIAEFINYNSSNTFQMKAINIGALS